MPGRKTTCLRAATAVATRLAPPRRGSVLIYCVFLLFALLAIGSLAVDYAVVSMTEAELRGAVDAACMAASTGLTVSPTEARTRAKTIAAANRVAGQPLTLLDSDIQLGTYVNGTFTIFSGLNENNADAVRINARLLKSRGTQLNLILLPLVGGLKYVEPGESAIGNADRSSSAVVIVQDISTSFTDEMPDAKAGDKALLDSLYAANNGSAFGMVGFSGNGQTFITLKTILGNYDSMVSSLNSVQVAGNPGMQSPSGTDIAAGIEQALPMFTSYIPPANTTKAIVIVSDGAPSQYYTGKHYWLNNTQLLKLAQTDADTAWSRGIHVYVVFFDRENDQNASNRLRTLIRGQGVYVYVQDPAQLPTAIGNICTRLPSKLVK